MYVNASHQRKTADQTHTLTVDPTRLDPNIFDPVTRA